MGKNAAVQKQAKTPWRTLRPARRCQPRPLRPLTLPKPEQEAELCEAAVEAAFTIITEVKDGELRRQNLRAILNRAYEGLKSTAN